MALHERGQAFFNTLTFFVAYVAGTCCWAMRVSDVRIADAELTAAVRAGRGVADASLWSCSTRDPKPSMVPVMSALRTHDAFRATSL